MPVDLHVHTTASDGSLAPSVVVRSAAMGGVTVLAVTDHDSVGGIAEALEAAKACGIELIPGVELSAGAVEDGDVHILGLALDHTSEALLGTLEGLRERRVERAHEMTDRLSAAGHPLAFEDVLAAAGGGSVGRVHIAQALVACGSADTITTAFTDFIGRGAPFYVHKTTLDPHRAIDLIHAAGGIAVLAHPGLSGASALAMLVEAGLDGIEAFHAEHTTYARDRFASLAQKHGLIVTGGSDYHGPRVHSAPIGAGGCPASAPAAVRERAGLYRR